jgi:subtilisin family serine protease/Leucine-rich repeat (LRR) protein
VVLAQEPQSTFEPRVVIVQFEPGTVIGAGVAKTGLTAFDRTVARYEVEVIERAFPFLDYVEPTPKTAQNLAALRRTYYVRYRTETEPERVARALSAVQGVVYAEPVLVHRVFGPEPQTDPSDSFYGDQTYLQHMRLPEAWDIVKGEDGTPSAVIAIVDGGSDWRHEDLLANVWTNEDEIPGNGIDDDTNGFIDDVHGANFANGNDRDHDPKPQPGNTHGTRVAGVASAVTDNATGLAGAAWNAELMHVNAACWDDIGSICHGYDGILYAAINGADIINASWSGFPGSRRLRAITQTLDLATDMGALVVTSAGNDNINSDVLPNYPGGYHRVLSVGATERDSRRRAGFSQYGKTVNVFAPGVGIITTLPGNEYDLSANGTSFASPLVSGVAALIKTQFPNISPDALREQLRLSSENLDAENPGQVGQLGSGYVNAKASLQAATVPAVRVKRWSWRDADGDGRIDSGDQVTVDATVVNYLSAARSLTLELVEAESYPFITMTAAEYQLGALERGDSAEVTFQFEVAANAPLNVSITFYARIRDGAFKDEADTFSFGINRRLDVVHASLSALYVATDGDNWTDNTRWDITMVPTEEELSRWFGVQTALGGVVGLGLHENNLTGTLPSEWGGLSELESLSLSRNSLSGPVPAELGQLSELRELWLWRNSLSGSIPTELGQLLELESLSLSRNLLSGPIPAELGQLSKLRELILWDNSLTGPIPVELGQLSQLEILSLSRNSLSGPIPAELGQLSNLRELFLHRNPLSGPIPAELGQLSKLRELFLYRNSLSGYIPAELGQLSELEEMWLSTNSLSGSIPAELGQLSELKILALHRNSLSGLIPAGLGQLLELERLLLYSNLLSGPIPTELGRLSELRELVLHGNSLSGPIPAELGRLSELRELVLHGNSLSGPIPAELGQLSELRELSLNNNSLTGMLPRSLMQLDSLRQFSFGGQDLCAPSDDEFQAWLHRISDVSGPTCAFVAPVSFTEGISDQFFPSGQTIAPVILPEATGGVSPISYGLAPALPTGLTFDSGTRTLSGTPTVVTASAPYIYKAIGANGSADSLEFNIEVVSPVNVEHESLPEVFAIRGNYPNPFRDRTRLVLDLPWSARVAVEVLDVTGRRVLTVPAVELSAGWERSLELRGVALSSGLYLYRLIATSSQETISTHVGRFVQVR